MKKTQKAPAKRKQKFGFVNLRMVMLTALLFGIVAQLKHFFNTIVLIYSKNNETVNIEAFLFCVAFGLAIMIWTARGKKELVLFFSSVEAIVNVYYTYNHSESTGAIVMGVLLGIVLPMSNYFYCDELMFGNSYAKKEVKKKKPQPEPIPQPI